VESLHLTILHHIQIELIKTLLYKAINWLECYNAGLLHDMFTLHQVNLFRS